MASTSKATVILGMLVFLQVSAAAGQAWLPAVMSLNGFQQGEEGGPAKCDGQYHNDNVPMVALSSPWFQQGFQCGKLVIVRSKFDIRVEALVVDECDTANGCRADEISTSIAVWNYLGLDPSSGEESVTWSDET